MDGGKLVGLVTLRAVLRRLALSRADEKTERNG
jgi:hypothetical protein